MRALRSDITDALSKSDFSPDEPVEISGPTSRGYSVRLPVVGKRSITLKSIMQLVGHLRVGKGYKVSGEAFKTDSVGAAVVFTIQKKGG